MASSPPAPTPALLQGNWVGTYLPLTLLVAKPIIPPAMTNPVPKAGSDYVPSAALIRMNFDGQGRLKGKLLLNFAGTVAAHRSFSGTYEVALDADLGLIEGHLRLSFVADDVAPTGQIAILHYVLRSPEELIFILEAAEVPPNVPEDQRVRTGGSGIVSATLRRVTSPELIPS